MNNKTSSSKKKFIVPLIFLFVIILGLSAYLFNSQKSQTTKTKAATSSVYTLLTPTPPITRNSQVTFTVTIDTQGETVNMAEVWLTYQSTYMTLVSVTPSINNEFPQLDQTTNGEIIHIIGTNPNGFTGSGTFVVVIFTINDVDPPQGGAMLCAIIGPTSTPQATTTPTSTPTSTPVPTSTPTNTPTPTPLPTDTPIPTETPTPSPTQTPTPVPPTSTPVPPTPTVYIAPTAIPPTAMPQAGVEGGGKTAAIVSVILILGGIALKLIL
jgi:hypothetical protein